MKREVWSQEVYDAYVNYGPYPKWLLRLFAKPFVRVERKGQT